MHGFDACPRARLFSGLLCSLVCIGSETGAVSKVELGRFRNAGEAGILGQMLMTDGGN